MREPASVVARSVPLPARVLPLRRSAGVDPKYGSRSIGAGMSDSRQLKVMPPQTPDYIAFRIPEGRGLLTVVAALQPGAGATFPWAVWYSALTPTGEFKKAPLNYLRFGIGARLAKTMIEAIKCGGSLPADLVEQLSIVQL